MRLQNLAVVAIAIGVLVASGGSAIAQATAKGSGEVRVFGGGMWAGDSSAAFDRFIGVVAQLNMTVDFSLDKETKTKLQEIRDEWRKARDAYRQENNDKLQAMQLEMAEAYKAEDAEQIKEANQRIVDFMAKGPKADEYLARAKAALPADQRKIVEERIAKDEAEMKARMEKWKKLQEKGGK